MWFRRLGATPSTYEERDGNTVCLWGSAGPLSPSPTRGSAGPFSPSPLVGEGRARSVSEVSGAFPELRTKAFPEPRTKRSGVSDAAEATYSAYAACVALSGTPKRGGSAKPYISPWHYPPLTLPPTLTLPHKGGGNGGGECQGQAGTTPPGTTPPLTLSPLWERGAFSEPRTERSGVSGAAEATYSASLRAWLSLARQKG